MSVYIVHYKAEPKDGGKSYRGTLFYRRGAPDGIDDAEEFDDEIIKDIYFDSRTSPETHYATYAIYKL